MDELSPQAKAALKAYRDTHEPNAAQVERELSRFQQLAATGLASQLLAATEVASTQASTATATVVKTASISSSASTAAPASIALSSSKIIVAAKAILAGGILGGSIATAAVVVDPQPPAPSTEVASARVKNNSPLPTTRPLKTRPKNTNFAASLPALPAASIEPTPAPAPTIDASPKIQPASNSKQTHLPLSGLQPPANATTSELSRELKLVQTAKQSSGQTRLALIDKYETQFTNGNFAIEMTLLRAQALCELGEHSKLANLARAFAKRYPDSPRSQQLQSVCEDKHPSEAGEKLPEQ